MINFKNKKIAVVCNDAGGAELIASWAKEKKLKFFAKLSGPAVKIFKYKKLNFKKINSLSDIKKMDIVITGTGWASNKEIEAIVAAKKYKKKIISFLDHWKNYKSRFFYKNKYFYPTEIWVMDKHAEKNAKKIFKNLIIRRIKNPYLIYLKKKRKKLKNNKFLIVKNNLDKAKSEMKEKIELSDKDFIYKTLKFIKKNYRPNLVTIKVHPSESILKYKKILENKSFSKIKIEKNKSLINILNENSFLFGCETSLLQISKNFGIKTFNIYLKNKKARLIPKEYFHKYVYV